MSRLPLTLHVCNLTESGLNSKASLVSMQLFIRVGFSIDLRPPLLPICISSKNYELLSSICVCASLASDCVPFLSILFCLFCSCFFFLSISFWRLLDLKFDLANLLPPWLYFFCSQHANKSAYCALTISGFLGDSHAKVPFAARRFCL